MSEKLKSLEKLFHKFSSQLHLLKNNGLIDVELKYTNTFICPLCLDQFQESDIISNKSNNFLTEEDAPPAKLGGKRIALTCKKCNSNAGGRIDNHLINRIREIDDSKFYKDSTQYGNIEFEGKKITTELTSNGDGTLKLLNRNTKNNPSLLQKFIYKIKNKQNIGLLNFKRKNYNVNSERVELALLKTSYIIAFSKFGYIFLLDDYYQDLRNQIRNMEIKYDQQIFLNNQIAENKVGVYYVENKGAKSIFNVFKLKTEYSETIIGSFIPIPGLTANEIHNNLTKNGTEINETGKIIVDLITSNYNKNVDLFNDIEEIKKIYNWKKILC